MEMSAPTSASLSGALMSLCVLVSSSGVPVNISADSGHTVPLPCRAPSKTNIIFVEWTRPELEPEYVFLYRDEQTVPENQHPSFKNRVELEDQHMTDGNVSVILKNVTSNDTGTYECRVFQRGTDRRKRATFEPISVIYLDVHQPGHRGGNSEDRRDKEGGDKDGGERDGSIRRRDGLVAGVIVFVAAGFVVTAVVMKYKRHLKKNNHLADPACERVSNSGCET
ncbi:butyrophilin subfamily 2 member A1-like [Trachinotus anak]|uniref:butyrophilin subfamily 2 member A1-like n=1 Tax=Trachinotus anak TaxID=443729 RepID=UPI0039F18A53